MWVNQIDAEYENLGSSTDGIGRKKKGVSKNKSDDKDASGGATNKEDLWEQIQLFDAVEEMMRLLWTYQPQTTHQYTRTRTQGPAGLQGNDLRFDVVPRDVAYVEHLLGGERGDYFCHGRWKLCRKHIMFVLDKLFIIA